MANIIKSTTSSVTYEADGSTTTFDLTFPYLLRSHVKVLLGSTALGTVMWDNDSRISLPEAPPAGAELTIYRETPEALLYTVPTAQPVSPDGLNTVHKQAIYVASEAKRWGQEAAQEVEQEVLNRLEKAGVVAYASKALFLAADIGADVGVVSVVLDGTPVRYVREATGATVHPDGSRWRVVDIPDYRALSALLNSSYAFDVGDRVTVGNWAYTVVASDADVTTVGGALLRVQPDGNGRFPVDAFNPPEFGTDATSVIQKAISRGPILLGPRRYQVNNLQPVSDMQIYGENHSYTRGRCGLVCTTEGGNIFLDETSAAIHNVRMEDFYADATVPGVVFYNSTSTTKYSGTFRILRVETSNLFTVLFRCCPIYWIVEKCGLGFYGSRFGGTQEFRIFEAWSTSGGNPVNFNVIRDTKHYRCAPGATRTAAYTLRHGSSWTFEDCTAEFFECPIADCRSFADIKWLNGWIEWINATNAFRHSMDNTAPSSLTGPFVIKGTRFYFGSAVMTALVANGGGLLTVEDIFCSGTVGQMAAGTAPGQISRLLNCHGVGSKFAKGVQHRGALFVGRVSPWRNGIVPSAISYTIAGGPTPTINGVVSALTGENTSRISLGDRQQVYHVPIPADILPTLYGRYLQVALVARFESAPAGPANACYWANVAPSYDNITGQSDANMNITGPGLGIARCPVYVPAGATSLHIGFTVSGADVGKWLRIEGLHLLPDSAPEFPFFV